MEVEEELGMPSGTTEAADTDMKLEHGLNDK